MAATPPIDYKKGTEPGTQLPEGAAKEVNDQVAAEQQTARSEPQGAPGATEPVTPAPGGQEDTSGPQNASQPQIPQAPVDFQPQSEDDKLLYAPAKQGGGDIPMGAKEPIPPPAGAEDWLPHLQLAANDPAAPPQVRALFSLITYHLNNS